MSSIESFIKHDLLKLPVLASEHGDKIDDFIVYTHWLMAALFVGWLAFFLFTLYRFRASRRQKADYHGARTHASSYLEGLVALIEGVLLVGFSIPLWATTVEQFPKESENPTEVYAMGQQFAWNFRYAGPDDEFSEQRRELVSSSNPFGIVNPSQSDDVTKLNRLVVPVDRPVIVHVSSQDVIHSFAVHAMRVCQDATPGMSVPVKFTPTKVGQYQITCAQLCGPGHFGMNAILEVKSQADFESWLAENNPTSGGGGSSSSGAFE